MNRHLSLTRRWCLAGFAVMLLGVLVAIALDSGSHPVKPGTQLALFGTLDTQKNTITAEKAAGISVAMFELNWASFEPREGIFNTSYLITMRSYLKAYRAAG